jgi:hypothetical protein
MPEYIPSTQIDISKLEPIPAIWTKKEVAATLAIFDKADYAKYVTDNSRFYQVGSVSSGEFTGSRVVLVITPGEMGSDAAYHFLVTKDKIISIAANSANFFEGDGFDHSKFTIDTTEKFSVGKQSFTLQNYNNTSEFFDRFKPDEVKPVFVSPFGTVSMDNQSFVDSQFKRNGFYLEASDGTLRSYALDVPFRDKYNVPQVTWSNGTKNEAEYTMTDIGGCGARNYASVQTIPILDLTVTGKTSDGDTIYELKNPDHTILKKIYTTDYNPYDSPKISYAQFAASHPAFFWFDPFGRLIKFQKFQFLPQAECGKPVIYLYPQKTTNVSVTVEPKGGLTKSEPTYNGGWNVTASPDGKLIEVKSGKTYPYLFWEGRGGLYETPKKGFVISKGEVHEFLNTKLALLGLNKKEIADFEEFWEPHMQSAPYYFVAFLGTESMNQLAPLSITPKPDTVIRVLMDFTPLQKPVEVESYDISTPARKGFTVLEWGGVLR